jgi:aminoglycoside phosphotransferase (APT) family kinase protein
VDAVRRLIEETIARFVSPAVRIAQVRALPMEEDEQGWSGAEMGRYLVELDGANSVTVLTKSMPLVERQVGELLSRNGHANVPFTHALDLQTDAPVLACMEDVRGRKLGLPGGLPPAADDPEIDRAVARALAAIHARYLGRIGELPWLPHGDRRYASDFLVAQVWRSWWERALVELPAFAREFDRYTPRLEAAATQFVAAMDGLWREGTLLTLTHGELHREHILLRDGHPFFIDWATAHYAPLYLDLVVYFTPHRVERYREALAAEGIAVSRADFMERYREIGRYVGFKWLCSGIWQWGAGPTERTGRRLLHMIAWALDGEWPDPALLLSERDWQRLLARHGTSQV